MASCRDCLCDSQQEAKSHGQSVQEAIYQAQVSSGSKRSQTVSAEAKYDGQSLQAAKISGHIYNRVCVLSHLCLSIAVLHIRRGKRDYVRITFHMNPLKGVL